ncbi:hypothetical protein BXT84_00875 [Sulfobacillus thermotolerans]|uniref:Uncharacterized protein n=1 Tax=Sulfobacillus thermotolerans TaxID=338644 RepID=A0ABN5GWK3_9FIRM|nr:hypothetical protein BXT84_00875 [Sulfobacillus thermotolerans]
MVALARHRGGNAACSRTEDRVLSVRHNRNVMTSHGDLQQNGFGEKTGAMWIPPMLVYEGLRSFLRMIFALLRPGPRQFRGISSEGAYPFIQINRGLGMLSAFGSSMRVVDGERLPYHAKPPG